ncbi:MAG: sn-glycerol-3-phosphate ABC transporter ATP-binding protein UgpC [Oceanospirillaceae bacterium]|nr:sn-glycerol-3-phosphate ABC transporter ATP-binding protein UgpC [Oceanospirillaceae bacterium]
MSVLQLNKLVKRYDSVEVLHGIDLKVHKGEFLVLIGPSGCGKSTLLRMLAGLEDITSGSLTLDGKEINDVPSQKRDFSMVFQSYALYPHLTVYENIAFGLKVRKADQAHIDKMIDWAADILNLAPLLQRTPKQLSGGQCQRVAMGRALVREPKLFLFDEPLSNLDAKLRIQMRAEMKALHLKLQTTTVYVTHDQVEAMTLADRIVVMNVGVIEQIGTPLELYDNPVNLFVAGFLGAPAIAFIRGTVQNREGQLGVAVQDTQQGTENTFIPVQHVDVAVGQEIVLGIRPEFFQLQTAGQQSCILKVKVKFIEAMGAESYVHGQVCGQDLIAKTALRLDYQPGQIIDVGVDLTALHVFDANSGLRLSN